ncbi:hypothetical protein [Providencia phage vB_PreS-PatoteraRojo]|nr:hypothetical protein [Providencia phage vB_PreS-PatoteraRojo]
MSESERDQKGGIALDLSINIPSILSMVSMLVAGVLYINNQFADVASRSMQADTRLAIVEKRQDNIDAQFTTLRAETMTQTSALRADIRSDMSGLKQSIDTLTTKMMSK